MSMAEWLSSLKEGDEVAVISSGYARPPVQVRAISRSTAHYLTVEHTKYRRSDGYEPGTGYHKEHITPVTPELKAKARRIWLLSGIMTDNIKELSNDQLERIWSIMKEGK